MKPKVVVITGTSSGIGYDAAIFLASIGHKVYATMRNLEKNNLVAESQKKQLNIDVCCLDVTDPGSINTCVNYIMAKEQKIDCLINNAGFAFLGEFANASNENFKDQFATNFFGAINCSRKILPIMKEQGKGTIINISSVLGLIGIKDSSLYCSSKFALEGWSEAIRYEYKKHGVYVCLLEPGFFKTEIFHNVKSVENKNYNFNISSSPLKVAKKIAGIIESRTPKMRYRVGADCIIGDVAKKYYHLCYLKRF